MAAFTIVNHIELCAVNFAGLACAHVVLPSEILHVNK